MPLGAVAGIAAVGGAATNGETNAPFNESTEGGSSSAPGTPDNVRVYAMLVLDFSRSIFEAGAETDVVDGALAFIDATLVNNETSLNYEVAIIAFGGPEETEILSDFTDDANALQRTMSEAAAYGSRGTTDLYGAYQMGLAALAEAGQRQEETGAIVERIGVVWSDGAHEAGDRDAMRADALSAKANFGGSVFTIGVQGDDAVEQQIRELASTDNGYFPVTDVSELGETFDAISARAQAVAESNYVVGVCTPVALGESSFMLQVKLDGGEAWVPGWYDTEELNGDVDECDPDEVRAAYQ